MDLDKAVQLYDWLNSTNDENQPRKEIDATLNTLAEYIKQEVEKQTQRVPNATATSTQS